jgi:hypothetical protein
MSTRCSIVYAGPIHIYACVNTWDKDEKFEVCIADVEGDRSSYNGDVIIGHANLKLIYLELKAYFEKEERP